MRSPEAAKPAPAASGDGLLNPDHLGTVDGLFTANPHSLQGFRERFVARRCRLSADRAALVASLIWRAA